MLLVNHMSCRLNWCRLLAKDAPTENDERDINRLVYRLIIPRHDFHCKQLFHCNDQNRAVHGQYILITFTVNLQFYLGGQPKFILSFETKWSLHNLTQTCFISINHILASLLACSCFRKYLGPKTSHKQESLRQGLPWYWNANESQPTYLSIVHALDKFLNVSRPTCSWGHDVYIMLNFETRCFSSGQKLNFYFRGLLFTSHWQNLQHWTGNIAILQSIAIFRGSFLFSRALFCISGVKSPGAPV